MSGKISGIDRAIAIAAHTHAGQLDKQGAPYILHVIRVVAACSSDVTLATVAALHDVVEDDPNVTLDDLAADGFSSEVVTAVDAITRRRGERYTDYVNRVAANPIASRVKLADLADNLRVGVSDSLVKRYARARKVLESAVIEQHIAYHGRPDKCHASRDGECHWRDCPQHRDGEPEKSGRFCPLPGRD